MRLFEWLISKFKSIPKASSDPAIRIDLNLSGILNVKIDRSDTISDGRHTDAVISDKPADPRGNEFNKESKEEEIIPDFRNLKKPEVKFGIENK